jgi:solute carrier family 13 (sodium-dependent dicarboxylate transporter), member 2/3/5
MAVAAPPVAEPRLTQPVYSTKMLVGAAVGPLLGAAVWFAPLSLDPLAQKALAVVAFMIVYWVTEPIDHGLTAITGCFLFWALNIAEFEVAFSGFANSTPWFLYGGLLLGEAAAATGLARRIGYSIIRLVGSSYSRILMSIILVVVTLNFLIPSGMAQVAVLAPMLMGIVAAFGVLPLSNIGRGLFVLVTYTCGLFNKMILSGASSILTRGMVERLTGNTIYWGEWLIAFLPMTLATIVALWFVVLWLFPPEKKELPGGRRYIEEAAAKMGPWTVEEKKTLAWMLIAIGLWSTDLLHHIDPAKVAMGTGLAIALPKIGVLNTKAVKQVNLLLIVFMAGALSMGEVLVQTKAIDVLTGTVMSWMTPYLGQPFISTIVLFWTGFVYHFFLGSELSMLSTSLPVIVNYATAQGFDIKAFALIWNFSTTSKIFVYQSSVLMLGYAYGYFETKDLLKLGLALTVVEGIILALLVPLYWPLIGLWTQ